MVYIPLASLFGLPAAFGSFAPKSPVPEPAAITVLEEAGFITPVDFINPQPRGGSWLDKDTGSGLGEPLNVVISSQSSPWVLSDGGFVHYANALGFDIECFGAHLGNPQQANLGDGRGWVNQTIELRNDFGNDILGTCWESLVGGNHLRMWRQDGPTATTNALFLAVSEEENVFQGHTIKPDGYDLGRDSFVNGAAGLKTHGGVKYQTDVQKLTGLIPAGSAGINHGIAVDGVIALLTVTILQ